MSDDDEDFNVNMENGHYSSGERSGSDQSDFENLDAEIEETPAGPASDFDTNLPTTHKYLGKLDNISGYTLYDDGQIIDILAMHTNTLVFPGFTLPLIIRGEYDAVNNYQDFVKGFTFVLISLNTAGKDLFQYGVVMEVFENSIGRGSLTLKAKGRQRCMILPGQTVTRSWGHMNRIKVQILPDLPLTSPLGNSELQGLKQHRQLVGDYNEKKKFYRYRKYHASQYAFPNWVYDQFEVNFYVDHVMQGLTQYYFKETLPQEPTALSYWFVQNFQLTHGERLSILACNTTLERLRLELKYLNLERLLCCGQCRSDIANQSKVFAMSKDGVQSNYVNPGGVVYETVTVTEAHNFQLEGSASKEFSWFPGYAWTIMKCKICMCHLGWQFTSKHLQPNIFYGLAHSCLEIKIINNRLMIDED